MPQLRRDPVTREWVIIAAERSRRPSDFKVGEEMRGKSVFSPTCPFCPGNELMTPGEVLGYRWSSPTSNTPGWAVRAVPNKFPALQVEGEFDRTGYGMYDMMSGIGAHEVIIECPEHDKTLTDVSLDQAELVFKSYQDRCKDLSPDSRFKYIMVFRNQGRVAGASLEHAHSQLIALPMVPRNVIEKMEGAARYYEFRERCVYCDMIKQETSYGERVVCENEQFIAFCPFASKYPFETWVAPKLHRRNFVQESKQNIRLFAALVQETLQRITLCLPSTAYNFTLHTSPINQDIDKDFHWHLSIMPRLTVNAGFEMGTGIHINVTSPEDAAKYLRSTSIFDELV